ncbi:hypothetical protein BGHDH14_bgh05244 [Blumeria hordei DH14]|uniref:Uncharacterized protein n=1 Tax=Blumeria graminis f. sp. hordei (strain DH14) TaxID=546991 RepID=N1JFK0_BLUG1|nr:hypothetical protein BGHDH14_bgh05244 [Blumeria hordei DH14]
MPPRSAIDATRFTSTIPHASSIPPKNGPRKTPSRIPGLPGETPQEKVKRLRAAADRARNAQMTQFDRFIARGRVWADIAHTITTTTLIAASFIAGGVTIYALTDMIIYNRRKKAQFFHEQKTQLENAILTARKAINDGTATEAQINFIRMEDEHKSAKPKEKMNLISKSKEWLFSGLKTDEGDFIEKSNSPKNKPDREESKSSMNDNDKVISMLSMEKQDIVNAKDQINTEKSLREDNQNLIAEKEEKKGGKPWSSWIFGR